MRKAPTRAEARRPSRRSLEDVARRFRAADVAREKATERINFLVTPAEKAAIQAAAKTHGRSVTDYFLTLHRLAVAMVSARAERRNAN